MRCVSNVSVVYAMRYVSNVSVVYALKNNFGGQLLLGRMGCED